MEEKLRRMSETDITEVDLRTVATFEEASRLSGKDPACVAERFCSMGYNPYFRRESGGGCVVKISFANNGTSLSDTVASMLSAG